MLILRFQNRLRRARLTTMMTDGRRIISSFVIIVIIIKIFWKPAILLLLLLLLLYGIECSRERRYTRMRHIRLTNGAQRIAALRSK